MTELEEKFYKVMGIEPKIAQDCKISKAYWENEEIANQYNCFNEYMEEKCPLKNQECREDDCEYSFDEVYYPPITDHILLELVCILSKCHKEQLLEWYEIATDNIDGLKSQVLEDCIEAEQFIKDDVRKLFEE